MECALKRSWRGTASERNGPVCVEWDVKTSLNRSTGDGRAVPSVILAASSEDNRTREDIGQSVGIHTAAFLTVVRASERACVVSCRWSMVTYSDVDGFCGGRARQPAAVVRATERRANVCRHSPHTHTQRRADIVPRRPHGRRGLSAHWFMTNGYDVYRRCRCCR